MRRLVLTLLLLVLTGAMMPAKADPITDFWRKQDPELYERYLQMLFRSDDTSVLVFADSLDEIGRLRHLSNEYSYLAENIRVQHYFTADDSATFFLHAERASELALKCKFIKQYFNAKTSMVAFMINMGHFYRAQRIASEQIDEANRLGRDDALYYGFYSLGIIFNQIGEFGRADEAFRNAYKVLERSPSMFSTDAKSQILSLIGSNLMHQEKYSESIRYFRDALRIFPDDDYARSSLAEAYYMTGDIAEFEECYRQLQSQTFYDGSIRNDYMYRLSVFHMLCNHQYDEARAIADTMGTDRLSLPLRQHIYETIGDVKMADSLQQLIDARTASDHMSVEMDREATRQAKELEAEQLRQQQRAASLRKAGLMACGVLIVLALLAFIWRKMKKK